MPIKRFSETDVSPALVNYLYSVGKLFQCDPRSALPPAKFSVIIKAAMLIICIPEIQRLNVTGLVAGCI